MIPIVDAQREVLLKPVGINVGSGQLVQSFNSAAVIWSLAKDSGVVLSSWSLLCGSRKFDHRHGADYHSMADFQGQFLLPHLLIRIRIKSSLLQRWPYIGPVKVESVMLPLIYIASLRFPRSVYFVYSYNLYSIRLGCR